jgi:hypothetical protein
MLGLFDSEHEGDMLLHNVGSLSMTYMALHTTITMITSNAMKSENIFLHQDRSV